MWLRNLRKNKSDRFTTQNLPNNRIAFFWIQKAKRFKSIHIPPKKEMSAYSIRTEAKVHISCECGFSQTSYHSVQQLCSMSIWLISLNQALKLYHLLFSCFVRAVIKSYNLKNYKKKRKIFRNITTLNSKPTFDVK